MISKCTGCTKSSFSNTIKQQYIIQSCSTHAIILRISWCLTTKYFYVVCFTTSVLQDSTCRSETGSTASVSRRRAGRWSWCTGQICCAKDRRCSFRSQQRVGSCAHERGRHSLELLDPGQHVQVFVIAQIHVVSVGVPGVERMEANHVQPLKREWRKSRSIKQSLYLFCSTALSCQLWVCCKLIAQKQQQLDNHLM